jgi:hypothetical protein
MHTDDFPKFEDIFPFEYKCGGYFRLRGVPKKKPAPILHGEESVRFVYDKIKDYLKENKNVQ